MGENAGVQDWQARVIGRIVDEVDACRGGKASVGELLSRSNGLFTAAEIKDWDVQREFNELWEDVVFEATRKDDGVPGAEASLETALERLRSWAAAAVDDAPQA